MPEPEQFSVEAQATNAHVLQAVADLKSEIIPRLDTLEGKVDAAGLNGHTELLKKFLDEYAAGQSTRQAYAKVRADIGRRFGFLSQPKSWVKALFYAVLGGLGWKLVSGFSFPHLPFIH